MFSEFFDLFFKYIRLNFSTEFVFEHSRSAIYSEMKFLLMLAIFPIILADLIPGGVPSINYCPTCIFANSPPTILNTTVGTTSSCFCPTFYSVKVVLDTAGKFCCANSCPPSPNYSISGCTTCPAAAVNWGIQSPCSTGPSGSRCCVITTGTRP